MKNPKIMIVEDEVIIALELESKLKSLGFEVTSVVNNAVDAINGVDKENPDLILMDIHIQGDKDGIDTAKIIREKFGTPVIFSTAYLDQARIERAKITMPFGYVLKPIQERDLKVTLEMALYAARVDSERRTAENSLKLSEAQLQVIFDNSPAIMMLVNEKTEILKINYAGLAISIKPETEIIGQKNGDIMGCVSSFRNPEGCGNGKECQSCQIRRLMEDTFSEGNEFYKVESELHLSRNGEIYTHSILITTSIVRQEHPKEVLVSIDDVSQLKKEENARYLEERRYRRLFETYCDAIYLLTEDGDIIDSNKAAAKMIKRDPEEIRSLKIGDIDINYDKEGFKQFWSGYPEETTRIFETIHCRSDGTTFPVEVTGIPFLENGERLLYGFAKDISHLKKREYALKRATQ